MAPRKKRRKLASKKKGVSKRVKPTDHAEEEPVDLAASAQPQPSDAAVSPFPFQCLPPELRNKIYRYVLVFPGTVSPTHNKKTQSNIKYQAAMFRLEKGYLHTNPIPPRDSSLSLLAVNHAIHAEAFPIFYYENHFDLMSVASLSNFLLGLSTPRRAWLAELSLHLCASPCNSKRTFEVLEFDCPRLRALHITLPPSWLDGKNLPDTSVWPWTAGDRKRGDPRRLARDMYWAYHMRRIRGLAELTVRQHWIGCPSDPAELAAVEAWFRVEMLKPRLDPNTTQRKRAPTRPKHPRRAGKDSDTECVDDRDDDSDDD